MSGPVAITGARRPGTTDETTLVAQNGRIAQVGPAATVSVPQDAEVLDAGGRYLIPGLIDCHVHICMDASADTEAFIAGATPESIRELAASNLRAALEAGITTVRDLGGIGDASLEAARAQREGTLSGARCLTTGRALTIPKGHGHWISEEVETPEEVAAAVRMLHEAGAELIKIIATGGVLTSGIGAQYSAFSDEALLACTTEAHARGMRVAAHAIGAEGIDAAVRAGVDSIEHGCFLSGGAIQTMITNPTWLVATLSAPDRISHGGDGVPEYAREKSAEVQKGLDVSFASAVKAGVRIASGTDAGTPFNPMGSLAYELSLMLKHGMPLERILPAATSEAAALLGRQDLGRLEPGAIADCVLLEADPLEDVGAYRKVASVVQSSRLVVDRR